MADAGSLDTAQKFLSAMSVAPPSGDDTRSCFGRSRQSRLVLGPRRKPPARRPPTDPWRREQTVSPSGTSIPRSPGPERRPTQRPERTGALRFGRVATPSRPPLRRYLHESGRLDGGAASQSGYHVLSDSDDAFRNGLLNRPSQVGFRWSPARHRADEALLVEAARGRVLVHSGHGRQLRRLRTPSSMPPPQYASWSLSVPSARG